jgi:glycosyltransferase involved in cell wall biosynthesis
VVDGAQQADPRTEVEAGPRDVQARRAARTDRRPADQRRGPLTSPPEGTGHAHVDAAPARATLTNPRVLIDARLNRKITGIGYYVDQLCRQFGSGEHTNVRPICNWHQWRGMRGIGLSPVVVAPRKSLESTKLPDADVVHGPNFHPPRHGSARRVATFHDLGYIRLPECHPAGMPERLDALIRAAIPDTAAFLCDSEHARYDFMEHYGVDEDRCHTVHLGVAEHWFDAVPPDRVQKLKHKLGLDRPYLLHVGAMIPRKDIITLCEAFRLMSGDDKDVDLVFAGNKTKRWATDWPRLKDWMTDHPRLAERVHILDYVADRDLPVLYRGAEVTVSATRWEGFGLTILEGFAAERPVVSSHVGAVPEVGRGFVYYGTPQQPETYAAAILDALAGRDDRKRLAAAARHARGFTWDRTARETLRAYALAASRED